MKPLRLTVRLVLGSTALLVGIVAVTALGAFPIGSGQAPDVPEDPLELDAWLTEREAAFSVRPGLESAIVWADPDARGRTDVALVYLHGLSASRVETAPLADSVAADLGANLYYPRLAGHGLVDGHLEGIRIGDWLSDVRDAIAIGQTLGERVVLVGTSHGGALATWAAIRYPEVLAGLVLMSPNYGPVDVRAELATFPGGRALVRAVEGDTHVWQPENRAQATAWDTAYASSAVVPAMRLSTWVDQKRRLSRIRAPTLVLYSPADMVVRPGEIVEGAGWIGGVPKLVLPVQGVESETRHVLAGDAVSPASTEPVRREITRFLRDVLSR